MDYKYTGIILHKVEVGETDRIYTIYTLEAGKIRALGKGVRKPNAKLAGNLETITQVEIFLARNHGMGKITSVINLQNYDAIKNDLQAIEKVNYIFKLINKIIVEQEADEEVFGIIENFLHCLNNAAYQREEKEKYEILTIGCVVKILSALGYRLEMDRCVHCETRLQSENNFFSPARGGVLCGDCYKFENNRLRISVDTIKIIRIILQNKLDGLFKLKISKFEIIALESVMQTYLNWI